MTQNIWIVLAALFAALWLELPQTIVGLLVPRRVSGRIYLKKRIQDLGAEPALLPQSLLDELVRRCLILAKLYRRDYPTAILSQEFVKNLDIAADAMKLYLTDREKFNNFASVPGNGYFSKEVTAQFPDLT